MRSSELEAFLVGKAQARQSRSEPAEFAPAPPPPPAPPTATAEALVDTAIGGMLPEITAEIDLVDSPPPLDRGLERSSDGQAKSEVASAFSATEIAALLRRPASLRQAFVLAEIFQSPVDRWEENW